MNIKSMSLISMAKILNEIIQEAGDLENIEPYYFARASNTKYLFKIDDKTNVSVIFDMPWNREDIQSFKLPIKLDPFNVYNVSYDINDIQTQAEKTDYKTLIKIMKTISDIIVKFVSDNQDAKALTFFPANKKADQLFTISDPQKYKIYKTIMINNIKRMPGNWNFSQIDWKNFNGLILFKN